MRHQLIPGSGRSAGEGLGYPPQDSWAFLAAQMVKNPPAMWKTWVRSLGWKDLLEKGNAPHSSILPWRIPRIQSMGWQRIGHGWVTFTFTLREKRLFPTGLQLSSKQTLLAFKVTHLGTVFLVQGLRAGSPKWGSYLLPFGENLDTYAYPSICGLFTPTGRESLDYTVFFYWSCCGLFIFLVVESLIC